MHIYRICKEEYSKKLVASGMANRWNLRGQYVIYGSASRSLCALEMVVNAGRAKPDVAFKTLTIHIPSTKSLVTTIELSELPKNWRAMVAYSDLQHLGSEWYREEKSLVLKVPSAVIPQEWNYAINTEHPDFKKYVKLETVEDYFWDDRLITPLV